MDLNNRKNLKNAQKQPNLGMSWCIQVTKFVSPEFCHSCKVVFVYFVLMKVVGKLKRPGIVWN